MASRATEVCSARLGAGDGIVTDSVFRGIVRIRKCAVRFLKTAVSGLVSALEPALANSLKSNRFITLYLAVVIILTVLSLSPSLHANYWRGIVIRLGENRTIATSSAPKMAYAPTASDLMHDAPHQKPKVKGPYVPMYVALGMIMISLSLGIHTAKQQLLHCPNVLVSKKKRETLPEVGDPDYVTHKSSEFVDKSLFRRVALIQNSEKDRVMTDSVRGDSFNHRRHAETLKSVGVEPSGL